MRLIRMARTAVGLVWGRVEHARRRRADLGRCTYGAAGGGLHGYFTAPSAERLAPLAPAVRELADRATAHRFDLLGSGLVEVRHGAPCLGVGGHRYPPGPAVVADPEGRWLAGRINRTNVPEARRLWRLVDAEYVPIDWQLDFKSGFRWNEATWYRDVRYGRHPGVDVKVPWELARMQHLPALAWAFALASAGAEGLKPAEVYAREFRNQVLDFTATNPPRFGVNWACTMDVAIRAANWLVACDLLRSAGARFDEAFEREFAASVAAHGRHVAENLEWSTVLVGNHYLADVVGLLFVSAYLPSGPEADAWLALSVQELVGEVLHQFHPEGSNFEASTSYHRLSAEMAVYAAALVAGFPPEKRDALARYDERRWPGPPRLAPAPLPLYPTGPSGTPSPLPPAFLSRVERMAEFTVDATGPDGRVVQVGDNDNGRWLKLEPWEEDLLDHRHLVGAVAGLFDRDEFARVAGQDRIEAGIVRAAAGGRPLAEGPGRDDRPGDAPGVDVWRPGDAAGVGVWEGLRLAAYPAFGLYVFRSRRLFLAVRCGPVGQDGWGGHAHNDQLSFELWADGVPVVQDPGTYLYTPLPAERNRFRSTAAHATLAVEGREQNPWRRTAPGLFQLRENARSRVESFGPRGFAGVHNGFGAPHRRTFTLDEDGLTVVDECRAGEATVHLPLAPGVDARPTGAAGEVALAGGAVRLLLTAEEGGWEVGSGHWSAGYGIVEPTRRLGLRLSRDRARWALKVTAP